MPRTTPRIVVPDDVKRKTFNEQLEMMSLLLRTNRSRPDYDENTEVLIRDVQNECNRMLSAINRAIKRGY